MKVPNADPVLVKYAWWQSALFLAIWAIATWFRGLQSEIVFGGAVLIALSLLTFGAVYGVSKRIQGAGLIVVACAFGLAAILPTDSWGIEQRDLLDIAIGGAAFGVGLLAFDARTNEVVPAIGNLAGALTVTLMTTLAVILARVESTGSEAQDRATAIRNILLASLTVALYDLAGPKWKKPIAVLAAVVSLLVAGVLASR